MNNFYRLFSYFVDLYIVNLAYIFVLIELNRALIESIELYSYLMIWNVFLFSYYNDLN